MKKSLSVAYVDFKLHCVNLIEVFKKLALESLLEPKKPKRPSRYCVKIVDIDAGGGSPHYDY